MWKLGEIILLNQNQANILQSLGFKYTKRKIDNKEVFAFIQTNELMKSLSSNFEQGDFLISNTVKFWGKEDSWRIKQFDMKHKYN